MTGEKLVDGEVTGNEVGTNVFPILFRTYRYPWFARRITRASSPTSMAVVVRGGASAIPGDGMARQALLQHLQTLAKLYDVDLIKVERW